MSIPIRKADQTWLHMDRANNLMYIHGLMWFDHEPDWDAVTQVIRERLVGRFPVFSRRAVDSGGQWVWQDDPDMSLDNHVRRVTLTGEPGMAEAQRYISSRFSQPLDMDHPLWEVDLISGVSAFGSGDPEQQRAGHGAMVFSRFHHGLADGVRLVQVLLSLCDLDPAATPGAVGRSGAGGPMQAATATARHVVSGSADLARGAGSAAMALGSQLPRLGRSEVQKGFGLLTNPTRLTDALSAVASESNQLANTFRSVSRLGLSGRSVDTVWSGVPGVEKHVSWITGIELDRVREIGAKHGATINDALLAAVSAGLTRYLREKGADEVDQVNWLIPVSLKPVDAELPAELGNHFAVVLMPMPLGIDDPASLLSEIHSRMTRIKNSPEALLLFGVQRVIAETPQAVSTRITNWVSNKGVGILTNVPGPRAPMYLAGTEVSGILGWVPTSGDQPLGICIFSYNGHVNIGIAADAGLVPDPDRLAELVREEFDLLHEDAGRG